MDSKTWTKEEIREGINSSVKWLVRGVVALYERQTKDEQSSEHTRHRNGQGFNSRDAEFMTSIAKQILAGRNLTEKQINAARRVIGKYCGQLAKIANGIA
jgi:ribosomal protein L16/L10AE